MDINEKIEEKLGNWRALPKFPFKGNLGFAVFSTDSDPSLEEKFGHLLFELNKRQHNVKFFLKTFVDINKSTSHFLEQTQYCWKDIDEFQRKDLAYKGYYISGENLNWLGIYHPNDYFVLGANSREITWFCGEYLGHQDWRTSFKNSYKNGLVDIYEEDFIELTSELF